MKTSNQISVEIDFADDNENRWDQIFAILEEGKLIDIRKENV